MKNDTTQFIIEIKRTGIQPRYDWKKTIANIEEAYEKTYRPLLLSRTLTVKQYNLNKAEFTKMALLRAKKYARDIISYPRGGLTSYID